MDSSNSTKRLTILHKFFAKNEEDGYDKDDLKRCSIEYIQRSLDGFLRHFKLREEQYMVKSTEEENEEVLDVIFKYELYIRRLSKPIIQVIIQLQRFLNEQLSFVGSGESAFSIILDADELPNAYNSSNGEFILRSIGFCSTQKSRLFIHRLVEADANNLIKLIEKSRSGFYGGLPRPPTNGAKNHDLPISLQYHSSFSSVFGSTGRSQDENRIQNGQMRPVDAEFREQLLKMKRCIFVNFEHDQQKLTIGFIRIRGEHSVDFIKMEVRYATILKVLADFGGFYLEDDDGLPGVCLFFHLQTPPVLRRLCSTLLKVRESDMWYMSGEQLRNPWHHAGERIIQWDDADVCMRHDISGSPLLCLAFDKIKHEILSNLLKRLTACTNRPLEVRSFNMQHQVLPFEDICLSERFTCNFDLLYMLEALFSRGYIVLNLLSTVEDREEFFSTVYESYTKDVRLTIGALERVLLYIDSGNEVSLLTRMFKRQYDLLRKIKYFKSSSNDEQYVMIRKKMSQSRTDTQSCSDVSFCECVGGHNSHQPSTWTQNLVVVTPSRILPLCPEMLMSNRVLRSEHELRYDSDSFLRIIFRDDDLNQIHAGNVSKKLINTFVGNRLKYGLSIAGRVFNFVGASNSQLRDGGCYFLAASVDDIHKFRTQFGKFSSSNISSMVCRFGQCFTQSCQSVPFEKMIHCGDIIGGGDSDGNPYIFTDGCGLMSMRAARRMSTTMHLSSEYPPSVFQFRAGGYKGVLALFPELDKQDIDFVCRQSQFKFETNEEQQKKIELVKYSTPVNVLLNRPLINILDQVSHMQSNESHKRICDRLFAILNQHIFSLCESLTDEKKARARLEEFPALIAYNRLKDFTVVDEPFFRSLLVASAKVSMSRLKKKINMEIPPDMGRTMFGIADPTETLQYGQVFVRYTEKITNRSSSFNAKKCTVTGRVMITKNPCIVSGDVRVFEAVDIPSLHYLSDVVVFPVHGPRPHSNEMAGSDLDGDEYVVIWDSCLLLDYNQPAFDYTPPKKDGDEKCDKPPTARELHNRAADYIVELIKNDSIGQISNAHLNASDLYGIEAGVCAGIAKKHMHAVDFPKTGVPPAPLVKCWIGDNPPERQEYAPDYFEKGFEANYNSNRMNGKLFRKILEVDTYIGCAMVDMRNNEDVKFKNIFVCREIKPDEEVMRIAGQHYMAYESDIMRLMNEYGIVDEAELFSGCYTFLRNPLNTNESDNMSYFNTSRMIERRLWHLVGEARRRFFTAFGQTIEAVTVQRDSRASGANCFLSQEERELFRCVYTSDSEGGGGYENLELLASAYYTLCYNSKARKLLSLPWLVWDVLGAIVRYNHRLKARAGQHVVEENDPLAMQLSRYIQEYRRLQDDLPQIYNQVIRSCPTLLRYAKVYKDLPNFMCFCVNWYRKQGIGDANPSFTEHYLCLLLIKFCLKDTRLMQMPTDTASHYTSSRRYLSELSNDDGHNHACMPVFGGSVQFGRIGRVFLDFLQFMASRQFFVAKSLELDETLTLWAQEWHPLYKAAERTYYRYVFAQSFEEFPTLSKKVKPTVCEIDRIMEHPSFIIAVPFEDVNHFIVPIAVREDAARYGLPKDECCDSSELCEYTGCKHIHFRVHPRSVFNATKTANKTPNATTLLPLKNGLSFGKKINQGGSGWKSNQSGPTDFTRSRSVDTTFEVPTEPRGPPPSDRPNESPIVLIIVSVVATRRAFNCLRSILCMRPGTPVTRGHFNRLFLMIQQHTENYLRILNEIQRSRCDDAEPQMTIADCAEELDENYHKTLEKLSEKW